MPKLFNLLFIITGILLTARSHAAGHRVPGRRLPLFNAGWLIGPFESSGADHIVQLTFPLRFERPAAQPPLHQAKTPVREGQASAVPLRPAAAEAYPDPLPESAGAWQVQVDMTLVEAEDLLERLRSCIAAARESLPPAALALAGLKIGAAPPAARKPQHPPKLAAQSKSR